MQITIYRKLNHYMGFDVFEATSKNEFVAMVEMTTKRIFVSKNIFPLFTEEEQMAILAHEIGHIKCGHYTNPERNIREEFEADNFAAVNSSPKDILSAIQKTNKISYWRMQNGFIDPQKFQKINSENYKRINNMLDFLRVGK